MASRIDHPGTSLARGAWLALCGLTWLGCAVTPRGATGTDLARARAEAAPGAAVYARECSGCHGQSGEGLAAAPPVMGPGSLPEYPRNAGGSGDPTITDPQQLQIQMQSRPAGAASRDAFRTALDLFNFASTQMPKSRPGSLASGDYWAVVAFLVAAQGASLPAGGLGPSNAAALALPRR